MCEQLAMPKRLRGPQVRALIDARLGGDPKRFAAAYVTYKSGRKFRSEQDLLDQAENGDAVAMLTLWGWFINDAVEDQKTIITDDEAKRRLELARAAIGGERSEICQQLRDYFQDKVNGYADIILYPGQQAEKTARERASRGDTESNTLPSAATRPSGIYGQTQLSPVVSSAVATATRDHATEIARENDNVQTQWNKLANSILGSAERMWRDLFLDPKNPPHERTLLSIAHVSQQLMLLWLEVALYQDRAYGNYVGRLLETGQADQDPGADPDERRKGKEQSTRTGIRKHVETYHEAIKKWEDELTKCMRKPKSGSYFRSHQLESQQFRRLIPQFSNAKSNELGWTAQATDAKAELRYQLRDEVRREYRAGGHPVAAFGMYILKITTGYGTRPAYFFSTVGILFLVDMALFFLNDVFNPGILNSQRFCATSAPHIQTWTNYWDEVMRYAYIAITHLTSLGLNSQLTSYCGGTFSEVVVVFSTVAGYFMLGLLSAMLYTQLTQSD